MVLRCITYLKELKWTIIKVSAGVRMAGYKQGFSSEVENIVGKQTEGTAVKNIRTEETNSLTRFNSGSIRGKAQKARSRCKLCSLHNKKVNGRLKET